CAALLPAPAAARDDRPVLPLHRPVHLSLLAEGRKHGAPAGGRRSRAGIAARLLLWLALRRGARRGLAGPLARAGDRRAHGGGIRLLPAVRDDRRADGMDLSDHAARHRHPADGRHARDDGHRGRPVTLYEIVKTLHILSATVLFGTGLGTAWFFWQAHC